MWRAVDELRRLPIAAYQARVLEHAAGRSPSLASAKLKLVDGCNLRCFMCDYWRGRREGELSTEEVKKVLRDLASLGCHKVHFTGGEVFLRRDAIDLFEEAARLDMRVNLTTNGTVLDKARARAMVQPPVRSITLSLDSPVKHLHDEVRGRSGAFKKTLRSLDWLLAHRGPKTRVRLNVVISARAYLSLLELPELLASRPIDGLLLIPMDAKPEEGAPVGGRLPVVRPTAHTMTANDILRFNAEVAPVLADRIHVAGFDAFPFGRTRDGAVQGAAGEYARGHYVTSLCHAPWHHTLINAVGDVYPCCMGHRTLPSLGNVREVALRDIWHGERYRQFRAEMREARAAICHRCDDFLEENRALDVLHAERAREVSKA